MDAGSRYVRNLPGKRGFIILTHTRFAGHSIVSENKTGEGNQMKNTGKRDNDELKRI